MYTNVSVRDVKTKISSPLNAVNVYFPLTISVLGVEQLIVVVSSPFSFCTGAQVENVTVSAESSPSTCSFVRTAPVIGPVITESVIAIKEENAAT